MLHRRQLQSLFLLLALLLPATRAAPGSFTVSPSTAELGTGITVTYELEDYTPGLFDIIAIYASGETPSAALEGIVLTRAGGTTSRSVHLPIAGLTGPYVRQNDRNLIAGRGQTIDELTVGGTYDIYYIHSTDGATWSSTQFSGTQFTVVNTPTGVPSGEPTGQPSGQPSSVPTAPSGQPTGEPTSIPSVTVTSKRPTPAPTGEPTGQPTAQPSSSFSPTRKIEYTTVTGNVTIDRTATDFCKDAAIKIYISFDKEVVQDQSIYIDMPGFTNGPCTTPQNGFDFNVVAYSNSSDLKMVWLEGNYTNMFKDSQLRVIVKDHAMDRYPYHNHPEFVEIDIDRSNGLKFSCMNNVNFPVKLRALESSEYFNAVGSLTFTSFTQTTCFLYSTMLSVFPQEQQTHLQLNLTMRMAMDFKYGDNITLQLPGFTRSAGFIVDSTSPSQLTWGRGVAADGWLKNVTGGMLKTSGPARSHYGTDWSIGTWVSSHMYKQWYAYWNEGSFNGSASDAYADSSVVFSINPNSGPHSYTVKQGSSEQDSEDTLIKAGDTFSIVIDNLNKLSSYCGRPFNFSEFKVSVSSSYNNKVIDLETIQHSPMIGKGCPFDLSYSNKKEMCSGRGTCNFCTGQCDCYDGFGSASDRASVEVDNFSTACTGQICPFGASFGVLTGAAADFNSHPDTECSSAGICNRKNGECKCFDGYTGSACQRRTCINDCSGRGQCIDMARLANMNEAVPLSTVDNYTWYNPYSSALGAWDAQSMFGCVCDSSWPVGLGANETQLAEYFGPSCEYRRCPSGDNPTTEHIDETDCEGKSQTGGYYLSYYGVNYSVTAGVGAAGNKCHHECSGKGTCDYSTGLCACYPGVEGHNCGSFSGVEISDDERYARRNKYEGLHALRYSRRNIYGTP